MQQVAEFIVIFCSKYFSDLPHHFNYKGLLIPNINERFQRRTFMAKPKTSWKRSSKYPPNLGYGEISQKKLANLAKIVKSFFAPRNIRIL